MQSKRVAIRFVGFLAALLLIAISPVRGQEPSPLMPEEVLASSAQHFPSILQSLAEVRAAEGKALSAEGAFDTVFSADGFNRVDGFYDGRVAGAKVERPFRGIGGSLYGGYGVSRGNFPIYEDESYTATDGTVRVGALFSLLRDRSIDARRAGIVDAQLALRAADLELLLTRVGVQQRALRAYWRWVAAGHQLEVYEELLELALNREEGLERQVRDGSRAQIFLTENAQNIIRRQSLVLAAKRDFRTTAFELSYYLRDGEGSTSVPPSTRLPARSTLASMPLPNVDQAIEQGLARRPELMIIDTAINRVMQQLALSENELKPRVDLDMKYISGLGDPGEGGISRASEDVVIGFSVSVPLERRFAKGRISEARAQRDALSFERQRTEEQIELELQSILLDLDAARELAGLAGREVEMAQKMREAERRRFEQGASDFFLVNLREEAEADARIKYYAALREARVARANYDAATVNTSELGILEEPPSS